MNCRRLKWSLSPPIYLRCGEHAHALVEVSNRKRWLPSMCLCFQVKAGAVDKKRLYLPHLLRAGDSDSVEWFLKPEVRGRLALSLSGMESRFPFGFLSRTIGENQMKEALVWPSRVAYGFNPDSGGGPRFVPVAARHRGGLGTELLNLRPYEQGDPLRLIHWKATARSGQPIIRQLAMEGEEGYRLYVNPDAELWSKQQFEEMCSLAGSLAEDLYHAGRLEKFYSTGGELSLVHSVRDLHNLLDYLALLERKKGLSDTFAVSGPRWIRLQPAGERAITIHLDEKEVGRFER